MTGVAAAEKNRQYLPLTTTSSGHRMGDCSGCKSLQGPHLDRTPRLHSNPPAASCVTYAREMQGAV